MRILSFLFAVALAIGSPAGIKAQSLKAFSTDTTRFMAELQDFFAPVAGKKEAEVFVEEFRASYTSQKLDEKARADVIATSNAMLKKRMQAKPDFINYYRTLIGFIQSEQSKESFTAWQRILEKVLQAATTRKFAEFLEMSNFLVNGNYLFSSSTTNWISSSNDFSFQYDSLPKVIFPKLDLKCLAKGDSAVIYNTSGVYYLTEGRWLGKGGKVTWERAGISASEVYAELNNYSVLLKTPAYSADTVTFYYKELFDKPLVGKLEEKVLANVSEENASYPRFVSYQNEFEIKDIIKGVDYHGGFSMVGSKFIGSGTTLEPASLSFYRNDTLVLKARSKTFVIRNERIASDRTAVTFFLFKDSIFHPGLNFKLMTKERELSLFRDMKGISKTPYFNTYHNIDMDVEALYWKIDEPMVNMQVVKGSSQTTARFESSSRYSSNLYHELLGMDAQHPLLVIKQVADKAGSREVSARDIARHWRFTIEEVAPTLLNLSTMGFIAFDVENDKVFVKDKLYDYLLANAQRKDYDILEFNSSIAEKPNATLSLLNYDLTIRGIPQILLSDSQKVYVNPSQQEIVMKKNRNFNFGGVFHAGLLDFYGKEFNFDYTNFKVTLAKVDSLMLSVISGNPDPSTGKYPIKKVKSVIQDLRGEVEIDSPGNKSGNKQLPQYPVFKSVKESFVYYDKAAVQGGVYKKDKFYFKLDPYTMDSLDNFSNEGLGFKGTFASASIFPDFEETLSLQKDYSLGFVRKTPPGGFAMYGGKAKFENDIKLSNEGLRGDGVFNYLTSTSTSDDFLFFPDSMNAVTKTFDNKEQMAAVQYPQVHGEGAYIHYEPNKAVMQIDKREKPIEMFNKQAEALGSLFLKPTGMQGSGVTTFAKAEMESKLYNFKKNEILADTADFKLASLEQQGLFSFKTNNVNAHVNFNERKGTFKSNGGGSFVEFPVNEYICYMDQFTWAMDKEEIELNASKTNVGQPDPAMAGLDLSGSQFISTHAKQDSLSFFSPKAKYDLKNNIIFAHEVKFFNVADAMIYPDSGKITIEKKAYMRPLENARFTANYVTQYHKVFNATLNIFGKKSYSGTGYYNYVDELGSKQTVFLNKIATDTTAQTVGEGAIADTAGFTLSPFFEFRGKMRVEGSSKDLFFDGATRIRHECNLGRNWMKFAAQLNPEEIFIPVGKEPVDDKNEKMSNGLMLTTDSTHIYGTFLSKKEHNQDKEVITASGFLFYDKNLREYQIGPMEKLAERSLPGNFVSLNLAECKEIAEGKMSFGTDLGQVKTQPVGTAIFNLNDNSLVLDLVLPLDFFFADAALDKMTQQFEKASGSEAVDNTRKVYEKALSELVGKSEADKLISQISLYGSFKKFPQELIHTMVFSDLKMKWNQATSSYRSVGKIGIGSIGKNQVNKMATGYVEVVKKRTGDILNIYLELDGGIWYYFNYTRGLMQAISSNEEFNATINELKADKRKAEVEKGQTPYSFMISTVRKKSDFIKKMEAGGEEQETGSTGGEK